LVAAAVQQAILLAQQVPRWAARVAAVQAKPKQLARWAQQAKASVAATVAAAPVALAAAAAARVLQVRLPYRLLSQAMVAMDWQAPSQAPHNILAAAAVVRQRTTQPSLQVMA
jgi:hypothetical protein